MIKLYKRLESGELKYHEAWADETVVVEHWGKVGSRGAHRQHPLNNGLDEEANLFQVLGPALEKGFHSFADEEHTSLRVEFEASGDDADTHRHKSQALEARLDQTLGWTGLGHVEKSSIEATTIAILCSVVDFEIAKRVIKQDLKDSDLGEYQRIFAP